MSRHPPLPLPHLHGPLPLPLLPLGCAPPHLEQELHDHGEVLGSGAGQRLWRHGGGVAMHREVGDERVHAVVEEVLVAQGARVLLGARGFAAEGAGASVNYRPASPCRAWTILHHGAGRERLARLGGDRGTAELRRGEAPLTVLAGENSAGLAGTRIQGRGAEDPEGLPTAHDETIGEDFAREE